MKKEMEDRYRSDVFRETYERAGRKLEKYLRELDERYKKESGNSFIRYMESRMKSFDSIVKKMERKGLEFTPDTMENRLHDIFGVRVICYDIRQIYWIARKIADERAYEIFKVKDYVRKPKKNGYESYHIVLLVPVSYGRQESTVKVELQLRTILMDAWASLDTRLRYKKEETAPQALEEQIRKFSKWSRKMDAMMQTMLENKKKSNIFKRKSNIFKKKLDFPKLSMYNVKCCDMIAVKREVAAQGCRFSVERMSS